MYSSAKLILSSGNSGSFTQKLISKWGSILSFGLLTKKSTILFKAFFELNCNSLALEWA